MTCPVCSESRSVLRGMFEALRISHEFDESLPLPVLLRRLYDALGRLDAAIDPLMPRTGRLDS